MSFLFPAFLLGLAALALPVLLHLLRKRVNRTTAFPALRFLAPSRADQNRQKIRRRVVLALRCLALALLALAFARPFFGAPPKNQSRATIVVIDNSFSLQAGNRWPTLRRWVREQIGAPARGETIGLLLMNPRPTWLVPPTSDTASALAALESLAPGWESTRAEPALRLAGDILAVAPARERRILYLGDHQALGWSGADFSQPLPPGVALLFPDPSPPPARQAALAATLLREGDSTTIAITTRNFTAAHARTVSVFAETIATPIAKTQLALQPNDETTLRLPLPVSAIGPAPRWYRVALDADDLPADDTVWLVAPSPRAAGVPVLLDRPASTGADHLATAFASLAELPPGLHVLRPPAAAWPAPALAVLREDASFAGLAAERLDAFLASGGGALVFLGDGPDRLRWLSKHGVTPRPVATAPARIGDWAPDHPFVGPLAARGLRQLVGWEFARAWSLPAEACEPIAFWSDGTPALGQFAVGPGRVLLAGWQPDRAAGDWPVNAAFVPFVHRAATHLLDLAEANTSAGPRVGNPLSLPGTGAWRALSGPDSDRKPSSPAKASDSVTPAAPGLYEFAPAGAPPRLYAVCLDPAESDLAPASADRPWQGLANPRPAPAKSKDSPSSAAILATEPQSPLWWWAFAALACFALAELGLANRTSR